MAKKTNPWQQNWIETGILSEGGGQGKILFVVRSGDESADNRFVLKVLKDQKNSERRARMHREVAALQTLDHPGIPTCVDSNTNLFRDLSVKLFLVTNYVEGPTLEECVKQAPVDCGLAIACVVNILEIVEYCHSRGIVHRDMKPANIILRKEDLLDPVLLDFGLAFNEDDMSEDVTYTGQELGNRFLHLPELQHSGLAQRDWRADLAQCCGILFHLVTGETPRTLRDKDGPKPHARPRALKMLKSLPPATRDRLYAVFERGFEHEIYRRFQTVDELRHLLMDTTALSGDREAEALKIGRIKAAIGLDEIHHREKNYVFLLEETHRIVDEACLEVAADLFGEHADTSDEHDLDVPNLRLKAVKVISSKTQPEKAFRPTFLATITESELRVFANEEDGRSTTILISPIDGPNDWLAMQKTLRSYCIARIDDLYSGHMPTRLTRPLPELMPTPFTRSEMPAILSQLPLRAIVAFAARCARRAQPAVSASAHLRTRPVSVCRPGSRLFRNRTFGTILARCRTGVTVIACGLRHSVLNE
jgi:eukaryotic-like serine/threonine-protein kinase